jgi:hypothetical protein
MKNQAAGPQMILIPSPSLSLCFINYRSSPTRLAATGNRAMSQTLGLDDSSSTALLSPWGQGLTLSLSLSVRDRQSGSIQ